MKTAFFAVVGYVVVFAAAGALVGASAVYLYEKGKAHHAKKLAKAKAKS